MVQAAAFVLWVKAEGWRLFCERMEVPPFLIWEQFPGYDRLKKSLALAERDAFDPEGYRRWLNEIRSKGGSEVTNFP